MACWLQAIHLDVEPPRSPMVGLGKRGDVLFRKALDRLLVLLIQKLYVQQRTQLPAKTGAC